MTQLTSTERNEAIVNVLPNLTRYAYRLARNPHDAEDLVNESVVKALDRFSQFKPGTNLCGWMMTILHNEFTDRCRRKSRRGENANLDDWEDRAATPQTQDRQIQAKQDIKAFGRLDRQQRRILMLAGYHGASYNDMAKTLGISLGTVKSKLYRSRARFKDIREQMESPGPTGT